MRRTTTAWSCGSEPDRSPSKTLGVLEGSSDKQLLFSYYPDELDFTVDEPIGATIDEAHARMVRKER